MYETQTIEYLVPLYTTYKWQSDNLNYTDLAENILYGVSDNGSFYGNLSLRIGLIFNYKILLLNYIWFILWKSKFT